MTDQTQNIVPLTLSASGESLPGAYEIMADTSQYTADQAKGFESALEKAPDLIRAIYCGADQPSIRLNVDTLAGLVRVSGNAPASSPSEQQRAEFRAVIKMASPDVQMIFSETFGSLL